MPLTMRPLSVNNFALSKVWFRCSSVNLREGDISTINSSIKSWLYADLYEKPSEAIMCRPTNYGGLGVQSVRYRSQAMLIRTFMETAINPKYRHSLLHSLLYRYHILGDSSVPDPGHLPYYPPAFFDSIKTIKERVQSDITTMSIKQWTSALTEAYLTKEPMDHAKYKPCRAELLSPTSEWDHIWRISRLPGLGSELTSFSFKLLHRLVVTKDRMHQITPTVSPSCTLCEDGVAEDLTHAFIYCRYNQEVGQKMLNCIQHLLPAVRDQGLLHLDLPGLSRDMEFPVVFLITNILMIIWNRRLSKTRISPYDIRTSLEAKCILLRKTRFESYANGIGILLNRM